MGVYTDYFQKSKVFMYPLLGYKKGIGHVPRQTYIALEDVYSIDDTMFMCLYQTPMTKKFILFLEKHVFSHQHFYKHIKLSERRHLIVYDFTSLKFDYDNFIKGKYSNISIDSKINILDYFGDDDKVSEYVHSFLSPQESHEEYAEFLNVSVRQLKDVHEICTPPDLEKETLVDNNYLLARLLEDTSISLSNK